MAVAYSGGLDSRFLCHAALLRGCDVLAVHVFGPHIPAQESAGATAWAQQRGLPLRTARFDPLALPEVASNSPQRCYGCKTGLVQLLRGELAAPCGRRAGARAVRRNQCGRFAGLQAGVARAGRRPRAFTPGRGRAEQGGHLRRPRHWAGQARAAR